MRTKNRAATKKMCDRFDGLGSLRGFAGDNAEIKLRHFAGVVRSVQVRVEVMRAGNANAMFLQRPRMFGTPDIGPDFGNFRQVRGVKASDRSATDDAYMLDQCLSRM